MAAGDAVVVNVDGAAVVEEAAVVVLLVEAGVRTGVEVPATAEAGALEYWMKWAWSGARWP